ncbi:Uncharacterised protein [Salmonella enterica subsp. enterica serovar Bovismorbificans]|uniref:Uncharacterized protein n=1 Tax=Salmonella enterica subsp. enterica serovar Bovismorbificans TaxID=58097 RepID=A0A655C5D2_SALET|nr:Uncharacterised protein [Salmonella enterica subsp. enterica serovar Bovismorbificans]
MLVFERGHVFARSLGLFYHKHFIRRRADTERRLNVLYRNRFVLMHDVADNVFFSFLHVIFPTAGIGAGALVRIAFIDVAGKQAAAGIGHA